jgi:L-aminopeptidase/D-esterase-like protein
MSGADFSALGIAVGHATDEAGATGVTVVRGVGGAMRGASWIVGRATGTRELPATAPDHIADRVDAVLLAGGSAFGLDAAEGVMRWMAERGRGFPVGGTGQVVPIVPAAVIFDLAPLGRFESRPTPAMGYEACERAAPREIGEGSVGAGAGATVGKGLGPARSMKGGVGCGLSSSGGVTVGALAVVNAFGDVRDAAGRILAGARAPNGAWADTAALVAAGGSAPRFDARGATAGHHTTICCLTTNAGLSRLELRQVAAAAAAALYRRITPAGTSLDGDVIVALGPYDGVAAPLLQVEALAVLALEDAIERAVRTARGRDGIPGLADGG